MRITSPASRRKARIEIIPLIDVVFFLLATFVMLSLSMVKNQGINVNLPTASTGIPGNHKSAVTITVTEVGDVYINKERISLERLPARLEKLKAIDSKIQVLINADEKASFGSAVNVLDIVRKAGIIRISVETKENGSIGRDKKR